MAFSSIIMMCYTRRPFKQSKFMHAYYFRCEFKREHGNLTAKSCHNLFFFFLHIPLSLRTFRQAAQRPQICTVISESLITFISLKICSTRLSAILFYLGQGESWLKKTHLCAFNVPYLKKVKVLLAPQLPRGSLAYVLTTAGLVRRMFAL